MRYVLIPKCHVNLDEEVHVHQVQSCCNNISKRNDILPVISVEGA